MAPGGDKNSRFFHASTKQRRARNRISRLIDDRGQIAESKDDLVVVATKYFRDLFQTSDPSEIQQALIHVRYSITGAMNVELTKAITEMEVKKAFFTMHPAKVPGPDGMTTLFYQRYWAVVKDDLTRMVNDLLTRDNIFPGLTRQTSVSFLKKTNQN